MTGYTVHTGSSKKFAAGWDHIFGGQTQAGQAPVKKIGPRKANRKKAARKTAGKRKKA